MAAADLTTTQAVKEYAGISASSTDDAKIDVLVSAVSEWVAEFIGHDYGGDAILAETHAGAITGAILLRRPAASISAVRERGVALAASAYALEGERLLWRVSGDDVVPWAVGDRSVEVDYTTTDDLPADVEFAARELCAFIVKQSSWSVGAARFGLRAQSNAEAGNADYFVQSLSQLPFASAVLERRRQYA